ncbi:hypothetical protein EC968_004964 [Mortierella alpina]|nr:hypothetical protein EC968_004964 [Mortierella alpina]
MKILQLATALLCSSAVMAHYTLDYPASRGFSDDKEPEAPCGGFNTAANRTQFPLTKGFLQINSGHVTADIKVNVVYGDNPTAADFTSAGATPASSFSIKNPGDSCIPLDLSTFKGAADKTNATIQIIYNGGDSPLYQCADVTLVSSAPAFDSSKCKNVGAAPSTSSPGGAAPTSAGSLVSMKGAMTATVAVVMAVVSAPQRATISGEVIASPKSKRQSGEIIGIGPNSRLAVQLLDASRMDTPPVTLNEQVFHIGPLEQLNFPIAFHLSYDTSLIHPHHSLCIAARVVSTASEEEELLTWMCTARYPVITQNHPSDNISVEIARVTKCGAGPAVRRLCSLSGSIIASESVPADRATRGIGPNSRIVVQLLDVSLMDVSSLTLSEQTILTGPEESRPFPIAFSLGYFKEGVDQRNMYSVSVRVETQGDLAWCSTSFHPVLTRGDPIDEIQVDIDFLS